MGPESRPSIVWLLTALVLSGGLAAEPPASRPSEQGVVAGGVAILKRADAVDLAQPIPVSLSSLEGVKLAFQTKGSANACFTLHDEATGKDLRPGRGVWKLTGDCPHMLSRASGDGKFSKIAQTAELEYTDRPPAAGTYRYRVLAADYERHLSAWSKEVSARAGRGFAQPEPPSVTKDSLWYAHHIRAVHEAGVGKVKRGAILHHGDCIHYLDRTRNFVASLNGLLTHGCVNWSTVYTIKPGNPSDRLLRELPKELELKPEFCVISAGLEDLHPKPWPEDARVTPEDRRKTVENVLAMVRMCEKQGTVAIVATPTPFGHTAPKGSAEEKLSDELARMCEENKVPVARVFDLFRRAQEAGEDYAKLMADQRGRGPRWREGPPD